MTLTSVCSYFTASLQPHLLRRARIWDDLDWKFIEIGQSWKPGDVSAICQL